jgi:hypothetical protein
LFLRFSFSTRSICSIFCLRSFLTVSMNSSKVDR